MDDDLTGTDELDVALRRSLAGAAGSAASTDRAWDALEPRLHRARRRHRAAIVGGSLLVLVGVSAVALATGPMEQPSRVIVPAGRPHPTSTTAGDRSTTTTTVPTTVAPGAPVTPGSGPTNGSVPVGDTSTTAASAGSTSPDETRTYSAPGGRVTCAAAGGALSLVDYAASSGYTAEVVKTAPDDVEVRFRADGGSGSDSRIRVRIEGGAVTSQTE